MILCQPTLDALLNQYQDQLGLQYSAYRNHLYRLINILHTVKPLNEIELEQVVIAAFFHDLGLWTHHTVDYLDPSAQMATDHLALIGKSAWTSKVVAMIQDHHKIQPSEHPAEIVELFRLADWTDVTFGIFGMRLGRKTMQTISQRFPNAGFHKYLLKRGLSYGIKHPLNPMPIFKW